MRNWGLLFCGALIICACQGGEQSITSNPTPGAPSRGAAFGDTPPFGDAGPPPGTADGSTTVPETSAPAAGPDAQSVDVADTSVTTPPPDVAIAIPDAVVAEVGPPACPAGIPGEIDLWVAGQGNCSYSLSANPEYSAAVDQEIYAAGAACGSCLEVAGDLGKVIATVVDQYPVAPSPRGHKISLGKAALAKVAGPGASIAYLRWRWVPCPVTDSIIATLKDGSSQYYFEIMLTNVTNRVVKFEFSTLIDSTWREAKRQSYNYFRQTPAQGLPTRLRLTDTVGNVVTTDVIRWPTNPVTTPVPINVQFPAACAP
ncbi:MAG TPA: expansin EXLX1 family cellulose-binding protein [Polyangia bacterium]|jgi:expansin (peptidoglycan-binding protein)|nr:expansin EXLX1 family cellulose-binding protein [Polyangia bacterium]